MIRAKSQLWPFVWWPGLHPEILKVQFDWFTVVSIFVRAEQTLGYLLAS
jgi:hypothetical protein